MPQNYFLCWILLKTGNHVTWHRVYGSINGMKYGFSNPKKPTEHGFYLLNLNFPFQFLVGKQDAVIFP